MIAERGRNGPEIVSYRDNSAVSPLRAYQAPELVNP